MRQKGVLQISNPTANVTFSISGLAVYTITPTARDVIISPSAPIAVVDGGSQNFLVIADGTDYKLPTSITVAGTTVNAGTETTIPNKCTALFTRTSDTAGTITFSNVTGDVAFDVVGTVVTIPLTPPTGLSSIVNDLMFNEVVDASSYEVLSDGASIGESAGTYLEDTELCFIANTDGATVKLTVNGSPSIANTAYSYDRQTWVSFIPGASSPEITLVHVGDRVYFRNDITGNFSSTNYMRFIMTGSIAATGNCNSMYSATNYQNLTTLTYSTCFYYLFYNCTSLLTAPTLPATTLTQLCYYSMFYNCTSLTTAPELPATTLAYNCYNQMFGKCASLTTAPQLPATTLADRCYYSMFVHCTSLTTAPELRATTLAEDCYGGMFANCTSLTTAPALPATTLADGCYHEMFLNCTSLTTAPQLPATTLADDCYRGMFSGCTSLTTAPQLPATTLAARCYYHMFANCTSLTTAPALPATTLAANCYGQMFYQCASLTIPPDLPATTLASWCYCAMFYKCTSLATPPALPATTLADSCYREMFSNCTSLTTAPQLPATTLADNCYYMMFYYCISLQVSDTETSLATYVWRIPSTGTLTLTKIQYSMFSHCQGARSSANMAGESGRSYTYYTQNQPEV